MKLVLALGQHDAAYVDAYSGPPAWQAAAKADPLSLNAIRAQARALRADLPTVAKPADELLRLRRDYLDHQLAALVTRVEMLQGAKLAFDEESRRLYDAVAPVNSEGDFRAALAKLDRALPGTGPLPERWEVFRKQFFVPADRLDRVFRIAIAECRRRTAAHLALPPGEDFRVEYVQGTPWSAYNWFKGSFQSVIQVNTDLPLTIDRIVDLACHEGYPGHHVYNCLLEENLVRRRGWVARLRARDQQTRER